MLLYTLAKKELGRDHIPATASRPTQCLTAGIGLVIGFYDGFLAPARAVFLCFLLVRLLGYDFLNASINAKLMNVTTNIAAIALFALKGHVWWHFAVPLAVANVLGGAGHLDGPAPRRGLCARDFHRGGGPADSQNRLGCLGA